MRNTHGGPQGPCRLCTCSNDAHIPAHSQQARDGLSPWPGHHLTTRISHQGARLTPVPLVDIKAQAVLQPRPRCIVRCTNDVHAASADPAHIIEPATKQPRLLLRMVPRANITPVRRFPRSGHSGILRLVVERKRRAGIDMRRSPMCSRTDKSTELQGYSACDTKTVCNAITHPNRRGRSAYYAFPRATPPAAKAGRRG
jgi:hypothetical protein